MQLLGVMDLDPLKNITINGSSTTTWGSTRLRVALVLDNTGSMADDGKMAALKTATKSLLTQLKSAATTNGDVYVSIIPFSKDVNVGSSNYNASWIDWTNWNSDNQSCSGGGGWGGWGGNGWGWGGWNFHGGSNCSAANHNTWNGCITDRGPSNAPGNSTWDQVATAPDGTTNSLWPAEQYDYCPVAMMGLSYDWSAMNSLVDSMQPNGNTNQPIGLVWGWQSLVGGGPLTAPAMDSNYTYQQVIILLSDGLNTEDRWYSQQTPVDNRMLQTGNGSGTCANIKAAGISIYTIQVNTGGDPTSTLLHDCASKDKSGNPQFFMLTSVERHRDRVQHDRHQPDPAARRQIARRASRRHRRAGRTRFAPLLLLADCIKCERMRRRGVNAHRVACARYFPRSAPIRVNDLSAARALAFRPIQRRLALPQSHGILCDRRNTPLQATGVGRGRKTTASDKKCVPSNAHLRRLARALEPLPAP